MFDDQACATNGQDRPVLQTNMASTTNGEDRPVLQTDKMGQYYKLTRQASTQTPEIGQYSNGQDRPVIQTDKIDKSLF